MVVNGLLKQKGPHLRAPKGNLGAAIVLLYSFQEEALRPLALALRSIRDPQCL